MNTNFVEELRKYLSEVLGVDVSFREWKDLDLLPYAVRKGYEFCRMEILGHYFLLIYETTGEEGPPASLAKNMSWIEERAGLQGVLGAYSIEAFNRRRLMMHKVPFVIPGNQLYLPDLGIDLREHLKKARIKKNVLSPSTQVILFAYLQGKYLAENWTATVLAKRLSVSKMTVSRAIEELESHELIEVIAEGREKRMRFVRERKDLWQQALPHLRSPVLKRIYLEERHWSSIGIIAGMSALSGFSELAAPKRQVFAVTGREWEAIQIDADLRIIPESSCDLASAELEIWRYDPKIIESSGIVDPLSLYLSLKEETDERIEIALEQLLENIYDEWIR